MAEELHWCDTHDKEEFYQIDPYAYELYNDDRKVWLCEDCADERAMDI